MTLKDAFVMASEGLFTHKSRTVLTILGIVIGIASIMMVMSIGQSAQGYVLGEIQSFGPNNIFILPGREPKGPFDAYASLLNDSIKQKDIDDLKRKANVPGAIRVVPYAFGETIFSYESELYRGTIMGSTPDAALNFKLAVAEGRMFDSFEVDGKARVAVIGDTIKNELFIGRNPIGEKIKVNEQVFEVIGVLEKKGSSSFVDFNKVILAPYPPVQENVLGIKHFQRVVVEARSQDEIENVKKDVAFTLRENHNIDDPEKDDFYLQTQEGLQEQVGTITAILTVLLASVAAISLIVGGVGIMNIMFVSVTERTKEIGLRKALGATKKNILTQFLVEALVLTGSGGLVGVAIGAGLSLVASYIAQNFLGVNLPYVFALSGMLWGVGVSVSVGLVFGIVPARKAAQKDPITSLQG